MGQGRSKQTAYVSPYAGGHAPPIKKTGSLTSINFSRLNTGGGGGGKKSALRRTRSFRHEREQEMAALRERVSEEIDAMEKWVREKPSQQLLDGGGYGFVVAKKCNRGRLPLLSELAAARVAGCLRTPLDVECLPVPRDLKDAVEFRLAPRFDEIASSPSLSSSSAEYLHFSNGGRSVEYTGKGYSTIIMKTPWGCGLTQGRHAWLLYVQNSRVQGWIQIGVVDAERMSQNCVTRWDGNPHPFRMGEAARRSNGNFHSGKSELEATMVLDGECTTVGGYGTGDTIGVMADFDRQQLQWTKNGENYGYPVSFDADALWPSVSLDSPGEAVSLVYYCGPVAL